MNLIINAKHFSGFTLTVMGTRLKQIGPSNLVQKGLTQELEPCTKKLLTRRCHISEARQQKLLAACFYTYPLFKCPVGPSQGNRNSCAPTGHRVKGKKESVLPLGGKGAKLVKTGAMMRVRASGLDVQKVKNEGKRIYLGANKKGPVEGPGYFGPFTFCPGGAKEFRLRLPSSTLSGARIKRVACAPMGPHRVLCPAYIAPFGEQRRGLSTECFAPRTLFDPHRILCPVGALKQGTAPTGQRGTTCYTQKEHLPEDEEKTFLSDFVLVQRKSFFTLLEKGLIEEFSKRNPITNLKKTMELFFYPEYYQLTPPEYSPNQAIILSKSYTSRLYIPAQLTDKTTNLIILKWVYIGNIPLMTKRGHFILNGCARVIVNQMIRSPGLYYQKKIYENYTHKWSEKPQTTYERYYADLICNRGTWLRLEFDKYNRIWAQMKRVPHIPIMWFLISMGLSEKIILKRIIDSRVLLANFKPVLPEDEEPSKTTPSLKTPPYVKTPPAAWAAIYNLVTGRRKGIKKAAFSNKQTVKTAKAGLTDPNSSANPLDPRGGPEKTGKLPFALSSSPTPFAPTGQKSSGLRPVGPSQGSLPFLPEPCEGLQGTKKAKHKNPLRGYAGQKVRRGHIPALGAGEPSSGMYPVGKKFYEAQFNSVPVPSAKGSLPVFPEPPRGSRGLAQMKQNPIELGRKWFFNKFMNPRTYDLGKVGRLSFNLKLKLSIALDQTTLTPQDLLLATDYLILVSKGLRELDDIDHLKNRRVRTSGELIQLQVGIGLVRLEKTIRDNMNKIHAQMLSFSSFYSTGPSVGAQEFRLSPRGSKGVYNRGPKNKIQTAKQIKRVGVKAGGNPLHPHGDKTGAPLLGPRGGNQSGVPVKGKKSNALKKHTTGVLSVEAKREANQNLMAKILNTKPFNGALKEFFGSSPLSQFMDQINPLAELTHKRRLSSMGPGGVTRDSATLEIRSIHPSHYGRICPVETPEGKNTGLVNSLTAYARVNSNGFIETPFYRVYKGQVQKKVGMFFFSAKQEEKIKLAASDLYTSNLGFLPLAQIPVRIAEDFTKISRNEIQFVGVAPIQMISIATSLIPFFEHDDGNRALMGSNMQRQAVPIIKPQRPIVGTGLEARAVSDSGHVLQAKNSGVVTYVSSSRIQIYS